jgi:polyhydroxyalkanoate synthesis regulator phasin
MPQPRKSSSGGSKRSTSRPASKRSGAKPAQAQRQPAKRKPAQGSRSSASSGRRRAAEPQASDHSLAAVRDLLNKGVVITGDRLQETVDEAVRRGRMTRDDAEDLVQSLVQIGRRQTQDLLAELEGLLDRGRSTVSPEENRRRTRAGVKSVTSAARRAPGTDKALQQVDRARRAAGVGSPFPIIGYDDLTAAQITERLTDLSAPELRKVRDHERRNANRKSVLGAIEHKLD